MGLLIGFSSAHHFRRSEVMAYGSWVGYRAISVRQPFSLPLPLYRGMTSTLYRDVTLPRHDSQLSTVA